MNRNERHAAILRLVRERPLSTQSDVVAALHESGHDVVQTTVSRDIHELGLVKVRGESGRLVYAPPEAGERARVDAVGEAVARWAVTVEPSGNLVVLTTPPGYASPLSQAIDLARHPRIAGSIAGENTVLLVAREPATGARLASELQNQMLKGAA
jgi:transcriptional regulator of arginine metabolism